MLLNKISWGSFAIGFVLALVVIAIVGPLLLVAFPGHTAGGQVHLP